MLQACLASGGDFLGQQYTLASEVSLSGIGLHTGVTVNLRLCPAPAHTGVVFKRTDLDETFWVNNIRLRQRCRCRELGCILALPSTCGFAPRPPTLELYSSALIWTRLFGSTIYACVRGVAVGNWVAYWRYRQPAALPRARPHWSCIQAH